MTLHNAWVALEPMLRPAIARSPDNPRVLADVMGGYAQLWAVRENGKPIAAIVTRVQADPERRCLIWLVGGSRVKEWIRDFVKVIAEWARSVGCVALWAAGRNGWKRLAESLGWHRIEFAGRMAWEWRLA